MPPPSPCDHAPPLFFVADALATFKTGFPDRPPRLLDVGCGGGRHLCLATTLGFDATGIDRDAKKLAETQAHLPTTTLVAFDVEANASLPVAIGQFDVVLTTFFLFRPLIPALADALSPEGVWIVETFHAENRARHGRPRREAFAFGAGEAERLALDAGLEVESVDEGEHNGTFTTQLVARKPLR